MLRLLAIIFGLFMLVFGSLGFIPMVKEDDYLFYIFHVNFFHNLFHLATGFVALAAGLNSASVARLFFQVFGVIYGLVALLGFYYGNAPIWGLIANNWADTLLHLAVAAFSLWVGFGKREKG